MTASGTGSARVDLEDELQEALYRHVKVLTVDIGPRAPFRGDSLLRAKEYVEGQLLDTGLHVSEQQYDYKGREVANLIAELPGAQGATDYYVIGAHYDTVPTTPGADDNASAVAVMLELAKRSAHNKWCCKVKFVAFTLEEPPAFMTNNQGSKVFVKNRRQAGDQIKGALILEMVGITTEVQQYPFPLQFAGYPKQGNFIGIVGNRRSRTLCRNVHMAFERNEHLPVESLTVPFNGWVLPATRLSDHASFWDAGIPAVMITDTAFFRNLNYHTPHDTIDTLDFRFMAELVKSLEHYVENLG